MAEENIEGEGAGLLQMGSANPVKKLVTCFAAHGRNALRFHPTGLPFSDFRTFVETAGMPQLVRFFREIMDEVEVKRGIMDFHLKIRDQKPSFAVDVYYGGQVDGPVEVLPGKLNPGPVVMIRGSAFCLKVGV